jgi:hypothetical protein
VSTPRTGTRDGLRPWKDVAAQFYQRTGERVSPKRAHQIAAAALRKMAKALRKLESL